MSNLNFGTDPYGDKADGLACGDPAQARATERRLRQTTGLMRRFMRF